MSDHAFEYPALTGRLYHRRPDGAVLRVEIFTTSWVDITCDVSEVNITWGDTAADSLTPMSSPGQCEIILVDLDGRYGPLPPSGFTTFRRWMPVRVWLGYLDDIATTLTDPATDYGSPGTFGGTPPAVYGGTARTVALNGVGCRFSGWVLSLEREPVMGVTTTWRCGDGIVRLGDQTIKDFNGLKPPAEINDGLREMAPGNTRVQALVGYVAGPAGESYSVDIEPVSSKLMMQSPEGTVVDLVAKVAEADLSFFWWVPGILPTNHNTRADYFAYRSFDFFADSGIEWLVDCDHIGAQALDMVSDDSNFYSAVRSAKGMIQRTVWLKGNDFAITAFQQTPHEIGFIQWRVEPGESYTVHAEFTLNANVDSVWSVRFPDVSSDWTQISKQSINVPDTGPGAQTSASGGTVKVNADAASGTLMEIQFAGTVGVAQTTGYAITDLWLIIERSSDEGPEVVVTDTDLVAAAELHEYEITDLLLAQQTDVSPWTTWIVNRSRIQRFTVEQVVASPVQGDPTWAWGMWHTAQLGDRIAIEVEDSATVTTVHGWIRGLEFRVAPEGLTMTAHVEPNSAPTFTVLAGVELRSETSDAPIPGAIPFPGGRIFPDYHAPKELPYRGLPADQNHDLVIAQNGALEWLPRPFLVVKATAPGPNDYGRDAIPYGAVWVEGP
jgi:hypothetical protein